MAPRFGELGNFEEQPQKQQPYHGEAQELRKVTRVLAYVRCKKWRARPIVGLHLINTTSAPQIAAAPSSSLIVDWDWPLNDRRRTLLAFVVRESELLRHFYPLQ